VAPIPGLFSKSRAKRKKHPGTLKKHISGNGKPPDGQVFCGIFHTASDLFALLGTKHQVAQTEAANHWLLGVGRLARSLRMYGP
jgi:hypothetical protein